MSDWTGEPRKTIVLPRADFDRFVETCLNPPAPSKGLVELMRRAKSAGVEVMEVGRG